MRGFLNFINAMSWPSFCLLLAGILVGYVLLEVIMHRRRKRQKARQLHPGYGQHHPLNNNPHPRHQPNWDYLFKAFVVFVLIVFCSVLPGLYLYHQKFPYRLLTAQTLTYRTEADAIACQDKLARAHVSSMLYHDDGTTKWQVRTEETIGKNEHLIVVQR